jgi:GR25 family glycosyltransferase involved in LPS biosynthesis
MTTARTTTETTTTSGLNRFDVVFFINLASRKDRLEHITQELSKTNIDYGKIIRIDAVHDKTNGAIGCSKSHCLALEQFLDSEHKTCLILEDDFEFVLPQEHTNYLVDRLFREVPKYDVVMFAANIGVCNPTEYDFLVKIMNAQTTGGYAITRKFARVLLKNIREGLRELERTQIPQLFAIDMYMKKLQPQSNWYCFNPKIGKQMVSYSDIERRVVNYGC